MAMGTREKEAALKVARAEGWLSPDQASEAFLNQNTRITSLEGVLRNLIKPAKEIGPTCSIEVEEEFAAALARAEGVL